MLDKSLNLALRLTCCLAMLLIAGCAEDTVTSAIPGAERALPPSRTLIHRFGVVPNDVAQAGSEKGNRVQTADEIRVGRMLAEVLARNLIDNLRGYGIDATLARETAPPEDNTISIWGQFMNVEKGSGSNLVVGFVFGDRLRTRMLIFQGSGGYTQFIAQADSDTQAGLKPGLAPAAEKTAVESDAKRAAKDVAERIANYYRKRGWLKP